VAALPWDNFIHLGKRVVDPVDALGLPAVATAISPKAWLVQSTSSAPALDLGHGAFDQADSVFGRFGDGTGP
jgi:hypothetical protein